MRVNVGGTAQDISARATIVATPAHVTKEIVTTLPDETKHALGEIHYGPYIVAGILTKETRLMPWDNLYAIATPGRAFGYIFNHANVIRSQETQRMPGGALMVFACGDLGRKIWDRSDDEIKDLFTREIYALFPESNGIVEEVVLQRWEKGYPYVRPDRHRVQPALERPLGNLFLAGDYLDEALMETAAISGIEAARNARRFLEGLDAQAVKVPQAQVLQGDEDGGPVRYYAEIPRPAATTEEWLASLEPRRNPEAKDDEARH